MGVKRLVRNSTALFASALLSSACFVYSDSEGIEAAHLGLEDGGTITHIGVEGHHGEAHGTLNEFPIHYPLHLTFRLKPTADAHADQHYVGLSEVYEGDYRDAKPHLCLLGHFTAHYGPEDLNEDGYFELTEEFQIPEHCMEELNAAGETVSVDGKKDFNIFVSHNPAIRGIHVDQEGLCGAGATDPQCEQALAHPADHNLQIFNQHRVDTDEAHTGVNRNDLCVDGAGNAGCEYVITVSRANIKDLSLTKFDLQDNLAFSNNECDISEHSSVRPLFLANTSIRTHGVAAYQHTGHGEEPLIHEGTAEVAYTMCPIADIESGECASGTNQLALDVGAVRSDETASTYATKIDVPFPPGDVEGGHMHEVHSSHEVCANLQNSDDATEDWSKYSHFLVKACATTTAFEEESPCDSEDHCEVGVSAASNNCLTHLLEVVRPEAANSPVGAISEYNSDDTGYGRQDGNSVLNYNVGYHAPAGIAPSGSHGQATGGLHIGGWVDFSVLDARANARTWLAHNGVEVAKHVAVFGIDLISSFIGSSNGYGGKISGTPPTLTLDYSGPLNPATGAHDAWTYEAPKECLEHSVPLAFGVAATVSLCLQGSVKFGVSASLSAHCAKATPNDAACAWELPKHSYAFPTAQPLPAHCSNDTHDANMGEDATDCSGPNGPCKKCQPSGFDGAKFYGQLAFQAKPALAYGLDASAAVGTVGIRGGVGGHLSILDVSLPATLYIRMADVGTDDVDLRANIEFDWRLHAETMSGNITAYLELYHLDLCWGICGHWSRDWSTTLFSWTGVTMNRNILNINYPSEGNVVTIGN